VHAEALAAAAAAQRERDAAVADARERQQAQAAAEQQYAAVQAELRSVHTDLDKLREDLNTSDTAKRDLEAQVEGMTQQVTDLQRAAEAGRSYRCRAEAAEVQVADSSRALCTLQQELQAIRSALQVPLPSHSSHTFMPALPCVATAGNLDIRLCYPDCRTASMTIS
jgi:chromosome segregation ATPase